MRRDLDRLRDLLDEAEKTSNYMRTIYRDQFGSRRDPTMSMNVYYNLEVQEASLVRLHVPSVEDVWQAEMKKIANVAFKSAVHKRSAMRFQALFEASSAEAAGKNHMDADFDWLSKPREFIKENGSDEPVQAASSEGSTGSIFERRIEGVSYQEINGLFQSIGMPTQMADQLWMQAFAGDEIPPHIIAAVQSFKGALSISERNFMLGF